MRRLLWALAIGVAAVVAGPLPAGAANSPAQIIGCSGSAPWCFSPNPIRVTAGSTIAWTNMTAPTHTATADNGAWDTGFLAQGQTSSGITFASAGTFTYHCTVHPSMHGTVIVTAAVTVAPTATPRTSRAPTTTRLAKSGGGLPVLPLAGATLLMLGVGVLATARRSRRRT